MFCPRCGAQNEAGDVTCLRCGTELPKSRLATNEEGPRPTNVLSDNVSTGDVANQKPTNTPPENQTIAYGMPLPPPPPTPDFEQLQDNQGSGGQYGYQGYGNQPPPGYGAPGSYRIGSSYQNTPSYGAPGYGAAPPPVAGPVNNYLVWSILTTVLCCLPVGIVAIIYSSQVDGKLRAGDYYGAVDAAKKAKMWCIISASISAVGLVLYFFLGILGALFGR